MKQRDKILDSIKGLAILLVVAGHCCLGHGITDFIYSFHMPVFFIVAGFLHKEESSESIANVLSFIVKRLKRLYIPFAFWSVVLIFAHNALVHIGVYTSDPDFIELVKGKPWEGPTIAAIRGGVSELWTAAQMVRKMLLALLFLQNPSVEFDGTFWFLKVLFYTSVFYCCVDWLFKKIRIPPFYSQSCLILALLVACKDVSVPYSHSFLGGNPLEPYALYHIGVFLRRVEAEKRAISLRYPIIGFAGSFTAIIALNIFLHREGYYAYAVYRGIVSLIGLFMLFSVAAMSNGSAVGCVLSYHGNRTLPIMIFHFGVFRIVTLTGMVLGIKGGGGVAASPIGYEGPFWALIYILAGTAIPLLMYEGLQKTRHIILQRLKCA